MTATCHSRLAPLLPKGTLLTSAPWERVTLLMLSVHGTRVMRSSVSSPSFSTEPLSCLRVHLHCRPHSVARSGRTDPPAVVDLVSMPPFDGYKQSLVVCVCAFCVLGDSVLSREILQGDLRRGGASLFSQRRLRVPVDPHPYPHLGLLIPALCAKGLVLVICNLLLTSDIGHFLVRVLAFSYWSIFFLLVWRSSLCVLSVGFRVSEHFLEFYVGGVRQHSLSLSGFFRATRLVGDVCAAAGACRLLCAPEWHPVVRTHYRGLLPFLLGALGSLSPCPTQRRCEWLHDLSQAGAHCSSRPGRLCRG